MSGRIRARSDTESRKLRGRALEEEALKLRMAGLSYSQIAQHLGVSKSTAHKAVIRALDRLNQRIAEEAEQVRRLELERLDVMFRSLWPQVLKGNQGAIDRALRIMERRARLLGLDAAQKVNVQGTIGPPVIREVIVNIPAQPPDIPLPDGEGKEDTGA